jgi:acetyl esterase/lipase
MKFISFLITLLVASCFSANAETSTPTFRQKTIPLYEGAIPNNKKTITIKESMINGNDSVFLNISTPTLTIYQPSPENDCHRAIVVCPGGGYGVVCYGFEGRRIGIALAKRGITSFVLKYRLPNDGIEINKTIAPLQDAQRAIQYAREHSSQYGIDPHNIGIMGFSAGGHLASTAGTHYKKALIANPLGTSLRPDFMVLVYPVITFETFTHKGSADALSGNNAPESVLKLYSNDMQVTDDTPPAFITQASDDKVVPVQNSLLFYKAMLAHKRPVELHLYVKGDHGFVSGIPSLDEWMDRSIVWMKTMNIIK